MPDADLDVLSIENLADFDAGARYLTEDLEPRIGAAIDVICKAFMKQNNWAGHSDWDADETWLASEDWRVAIGSGRDDYRCKVQLEPVASLFPVSIYETDLGH